MVVMMHIKVIMAKKSIMQTDYTEYTPSTSYNGDYY